MIEMWTEHYPPEDDPGTTADPWRDWPITIQFVVELDPQGDTDDH